MSLFGNLGSYKVGNIVNHKTEKKRKEPTLIELATEKFGEDKQLMMWIEGFLEQKTKEHARPPRMSWLEQLSILEKHPKSARIKEVRRCIAGNYRQLAYEPKCKKNVNIEVDDDNLKEEKICYDRAY